MHLPRRQLTNESVAANAFEVHRDIKLHEWVFAPNLTAPCRRRAIALR
jgi:hypothetical protein